MVRTPEQMSEQRRDIPALLRDVRLMHERPSNDPPQRQRAEIERLMQDMDAERENVSSYTVKRSQRLQKEVEETLADLQKRRWVNIDAFRGLSDLQAALHQRVNDLGPVVETGEQALNFAQTGAVLSTGATVLGTTMLGPIGGAVAGTAIGGAAIWLPNQIGALGQKVGIPARLTSNVIRAGLLGGAIYLAPAVALPAAAVGGTLAGVMYLLNRYGKQKAA